MNNDNLKKIKEELNNSEIYGKDIDTFLSEYSPWQKDTERTTDVLNTFTDFAKNYENKSYIKNNEKIQDFSWLRIEKKIEEKLINKAIPANLHYGIPNHTIGNPDKSNVFICLINPNINVTDDLRTKFKPSKVYENIGITDYYENYKDNAKADISFNLNKFSDIESLKKHITNLNKNIMLTEWESIQSKLNDDSSELDLKNYYYINNYLYPFLIDGLLLNEDGDLVTLLKENKKVKKLSTEFVKDNETALDKLIKKSKLCNIELMPFRSKEPGISKQETKGKKLGSLIMDTDTDTSLLGCRIIVNKIVQYVQHGSNELQKPIFIFRRYTHGWKPYLKKVLEKDFSVSDPEKLLEIFETEFFIFKKSADYNNLDSTAFTKSELASKKNSEEAKITYEQYSKIIKSLFDEPSKN